MRSIFSVAALVAFVFALMGSTQSLAAAKQSAQARSCSERAVQQNLKGGDRRAFMTKCIKGSLAPTHMTQPAPQSASAKAITEPSGVDRTVRSTQCNQEGAKRGLQDSALQAFRKNCLATAAPVNAAGGKERPPIPTPAKPKSEALTDAPRR